jgi:hypothetical protein
MLAVGFLGMIAVISRSNTRMLEVEDFKKRFGVLYEGQNPRTLVGTYWTVVVLTRMIITVAILVLLRDCGAIQVILLI